MLGNVVLSRAISPPNTFRSAPFATPQLIWRGTDFGFLPTLQERPSLVHPDSRTIVKGHERADAIQALNEQYDTLLPRWKGVALTARAELDAEGDEGALPWINVKFTSYLDKGKAPVKGSPKYAPWDSVGIAVGEGIYDGGLAKYKYQIDLGGGGGTTWSGTIEKLAMPGLLFHHVTPTKDYVHDRLVPWRHYVPVRTDLLDLRSKFDWAEGHPAEARRIADEGTAFMRRLGTREGFERMYREDFVEPMRRILEAYRPVSETHPEAGSWRDVLQSAGRGRFLPIIECTGFSGARGSCELVEGEEVLQFQRTGWYGGKKPQRRG